MPQVHREAHVLKVGDSPQGEAYLYLDEATEIPGIAGATIRIEFARGLAFDELIAIAAKLNAGGPILTVQR